PLFVREGGCRGGCGRGPLACRIPAISAFTRVFDALCAGMSEISARLLVRRARQAAQQRSTGIRLAFAPNRDENCRMGSESAPIFIRIFRSRVQRRADAGRVAALACALLAASPAATLAQGAQGSSATFPVGIRELDYIAPHGGSRHRALGLFYPAAIRERSAPPFVIPFFTNLNLYKDAEAAFGGSKHPLVMFSHGRGSNGLY